MDDRARDQVYSDIWKREGYFNLVMHTSAHYPSQTSDFAGWDHAGSWWAWVAVWPHAVNKVPSLAVIIIVRLQTLQVEIMQDHDGPGSQSDVSYYSLQHLTNDNK